MMSAVRDDLREAVDEVFGEAIQHLPLNKGQVDPDRSSAIFTAVLRTGDREPVGASLGRGQSSRPELLANGGELRINPLAYPALLLRKNDKIKAMDRIGTPMFEILFVDDRSHLRLICELGDA